MFSFRPVEIFSCVLASTSGLMRRLTRAPRPRAPWRAPRGARSSPSDSTLKQWMPASSPKAISRAVLPTPEKTILSAGYPRRERAAKLALRHDVGAGAEPAERRDDRLVGVRLQRVADQMVEAREGFVEDAIVARRASPSNSNRTACRRLPRSSAPGRLRRGARLPSARSGARRSPRGGSRGRSADLRWPSAAPPSRRCRTSPDRGATRPLTGRRPRRLRPEPRSSRSGASSAPRRPQPPRAATATRRMMSARVGMISSALRL